VQSWLAKAWSCGHWSAHFFVRWNSNVSNSYVNSYGVGAMQTPNGLLRNWFLNPFGRAYIRMSKTPNELLMCSWRLFGFKVSQTPNGLLRNWFLNQFGRAYIGMSETPNELLMCSWRLFGFKVSQTPNGLLRNWFLNQFGRAYIGMSETPNELLMWGWQLFGFKVSQTPIELLFCKRCDVYSLCDQKPKWDSKCRPQTTIERLLNS